VSPEGELRGALLALDRRGLLKAAGLAAAALLPGGCGAGPAPPGPPLAALTPRTWAVVDALARRVAGRAGRERLRAAGIDTGRRADELLARAPELAAPLDQALLVLEFGFFPWLGKLRPFTALSGPAQDRILQELAGSRWALKRTLFRAVRSVGLLGCYGSALHQPVSRHPGVAGVAIEEAMTYPAARPLP